MNLILIIFTILFLSSCASTTHNTGQESSREAQSAASAVVGAVTGAKTDEKDLRELEAQIRRDPQAQSAVESITQGMTDPSAAGKYCPVDGERYSAKFDMCPKHAVPLKNIEE